MSRIGRTALLQQRYREHINKRANYLKKQIPETISNDATDVDKIR